MSAVPVLGAALILVAGLSLASAIAAIFSDDLLPSGVIIRSSWLQIPGLALLVISAAFAVWARLALGFVELKIYREERLLLATFPDEYPRYRSRVPQLVPGLGAVQRKADPA
jgi:protein-S-isoprenylcysteine O-methyltransferase Ste14